MQPPFRFSPPPRISGTFICFLRTLKTTLCPFRVKFHGAVGLTAVDPPVPPWRILFSAPVIELIFLEKIARYVNECSKCWRCNGVKTRLPCMHAVICQTVVGKG